MPVSICKQRAKALYGNEPTEAGHQYLAEMPEAKLIRLLCLSTLVSKTENVMHLTHLVKQASTKAVI